MYVDTNLKLETIIIKTVCQKFSIERHIGKYIVCPSLKFNAQTIKVFQIDYLKDTETIQF